jgi:hypothetical protein
MRLVVLAVVLVAAFASPARADGDLLNFSIGPVFALKLSGPGSSPVIGIEAGVGYGPERINLGFEHRSDHDAGYVELDPWYIIGGTLGIAIDDENKAHGVGGVWEGIPVAGFEGGCSGWQNMVTLAGGYRYTGVHELFLTLKAGRIDGKVCFD